MATRNLVNSVLFTASENKLLNSEVVRKAFSGRIKRNGQEYVDNSIMRTVRSLMNRGLMERVTRGSYKLTKAGKKLARKV